MIEDGPALGRGKSCTRLIRCKGARHDDLLKRQLVQRVNEPDCILLHAPELDPTAWTDRAQQSPKCTAPIRGAIRPIFGQMSTNQPHYFPKHWLRNRPHLPEKFGQELDDLGTVQTFAINRTN
jgi:hypothetical protein